MVWCEDCWLISKDSSVVIQEVAWGDWDSNPLLMLDSLIYFEVEHVFGLVNS